MIFSKYHGTGNDFIIVDNRTGLLNRDQEQLYRTWCHRRFGIGADGVILLQDHKTADFEMIYLNADGKEGSLCGNGGRCVVAFAHRLGLLPKKKTQFMAIDGLHDAKINEDGTVALKMQSVHHLNSYETDTIVDTGSPHYVRFVEQLTAIDVVEQGRSIRQQPSFKAEGINVNFVQKGTTNQELKVATYERGVENETYSCGTGVVACSLAWAVKAHLSGKQTIMLQTKGGLLKVHFEQHAVHQFSNIWLEGPAEPVFDGVYGCY